MTLAARHVRSSADPGVAKIAAPERPYVAISGAQDRFLPPGRLGPAALRRTLGIGLTTVPGSGHLLADEQAAEVARFVVS
jgi:pimeloyl-ACP methyl ester carboxylesterase